LHRAASAEAARGYIIVLNICMKLNLNMCSRNCCCGSSFVKIVVGAHVGEATAVVLRLSKSLLAKEQLVDEILQELLAVRAALVYLPRLYKLRHVLVKV